MAENNKEKSWSHVSELERLERYLLNILPVLRGSVFLSMLAGVFAFYAATVCIALLLILASMWV